MFSILKISTSILNRVKKGPVKLCKLITSLRPFSKKVIVTIPIISKVLKDRREEYYISILRKKRKMKKKITDLSKKINRRIGQ